MGNESLVHFEETAMPIQAMVKQINTIQEVMRGVMKEDQHYGVIPGTDKPSLLKPGAEKLGLTFRLAPDYIVETIMGEHGHREYRVKCTLTHIPTGAVVGAGLGICSTMETKYRYISDVEFTGKPVPKEYWNGRDATLLGPKGSVAKKNPQTNQWEIAVIKGKVDREDIADTYNTCIKMAKKRAHVDAILTATAASDIFTQDIEEEPTGNGHTKETPLPKKEPDEHPSTKEPPPSSPNIPINDLCRDIAIMLLQMCGSEEAAADKLEEITTWEKDGKTYKGKRKPEDLKNETNIKITHHKVKVLYDEWKVNSANS